jgi:hypothetical protein
MMAVLVNDSTTLAQRKQLCRQAAATDWMQFGVARLLAPTFFQKDCR